MVVIPHISQKEFYIIIGIIAVIGLVFALIQIIRIRRASKKVNYLKSEVELKKYDLVQRDLESVCNRNKTKTRTHKNMKPSETSEFVKPGDYRRMLEIDDIEKTSEYQKVQDKLMELNQQEEVFEGQKHKFEMDDHDFKKKISKYDWDC
jgi:FtsZ-interacting cell division protein ZipA